MFKKSQRKIVAAIMSVLILLWVGTLTGIYAFSYAEMSEKNRGMLKEYADRYDLYHPFALPMPGKPAGKPHDPGFSVFRLSTFYTVAMADDGKILEIQNPQPAVHTDEELETLARTLWERGRTHSVKNNLVCYTVDKGSYRLSVFKDNTILQESINTLFRYTLMVGGLAVAALFFLAVYLARKIVKPLEESYQKQKQFVSDAGHELKTPISVVSTNAELLFREIGENRWLSNIQYENERMGLLVAQLLELSRAENTAPPMAPVDFTRIVNGEALPFESVAFENGLALHCCITDEITVQGNGMQLKQLVSILLDNAIRHSSGKEIRLALRAEHGMARLSVFNAGPEIPAEQRARLFERFYRADPVRNSQDGHYGLGLAIAKSIVLSHGGKISVHCGEGLVEFRVQIPLRNFS